MKKLLLKTAMSVLIVTSGFQNVFGQFQAQQLPALMQRPKTTSIQKAAPAGDGYMDAPIIWSYAKDAELTGLGARQTSTVSAAVYMPAGAYIGDEIRYIRIGITDPINDVKVFIRKSLDGDDIRTVNVGNITPTGEEGICKAVRLEEPLLIQNDEPLYIGYTGSHEGGKYPMALSYINTAIPRSIYIKIGDNPWDDLSSSYPPLSIEGLVWGDNLPTHSVTASLPYTRLVGSVNHQTPCAITLFNNGVSSVNSVDIEYTVNEITKTATSLAVSINQFHEGTATLNIDAIPETGTYPFSCKVTKVNGEVNDYSNKSIEGTLIVAESPITRLVVCEELTGTGCGFCPIGIEGLKYMREKYPDTFLPIGIHLYNSDDPLYAGTSYRKITNYFTGAPSCIMDRDENLVLSPGVPDIEYAYEIAQARPSIAAINISCKDNGEDGTNIKATANVRFATGLENANYKIAFVILEDEVDKDKDGEPILQTNYFSDSFYQDKGNLPGWNELPYSAPCIYDDVARGIFTFDGLSNSLPTTLEANTDYTYSYDIAMPYVLNFSKVRIAALLIDSDTGMIENAAVMTSGMTAIDNIQTKGDDVKVISDTYGFTITRSESKKANVTLYDMSGIIMWSTESSLTEIPVPVKTSGIYLIRIEQDNQIIDKKVIKQ